jgi:hypothetical protein
MATVFIPSSFAARKTRIAISDRLATSIFDIFKTVSPHAKTEFLLHCGIKQQNPVLKRAIRERSVLS